MMGLLWQFSVLLILPDLDQMVFVYAVFLVVTLIFVCIAGRIISPVRISKNYRPISGEDYQVVHNNEEQWF